MSAVRGALVALVLLTGLTACMDGDGGSSGEGEGDHAALLEADREAAGRAARTLATRLSADLPGRASQQRGSFRGCRGRSPEGVAAVEYAASARVDAPGATQDALLEPVPDLLASLGYGDPVASEVPGGRRWAVAAEDFSVSVTTRPEAGSFVLVAVTGACREIPAAEQGAWLDRGVDDLA